MTKRFELKNFDNRSAINKAKINPRAPEQFDRFQKLASDLLSVPKKDVPAKVKRSKRG